ncbi:cryptochrome/photolyase family protein [Halpernia frigidisoli]|uniref:Deoxyribodipyrimidine photo-lyase n=1 Tax=Halpernia frigidisoli TaxID=1125876 RepID=A0A1I3DP39_9FLAO|nr:deoxyribodipyrimidine photo-lyase [Halpernia frigidisoli]SFH88349.1 deoxyribodipyrimidine photo-lyase [Halpernia frigidisoli]
MTDKINIFWFRRDLRLDDNHALFQALTADENVLPIFIFDTEILSKLPSKFDARVEFIFDQLEDLNEKLDKTGKGIQYYHGEALTVFEELTSKFDIVKVFANEDYEPQAIERDKNISKFLAEKNIEFDLFKDQVIFHKDEVLKSDKSPYTIYTPYSKIWLENFQKNPPKSFASEKNLNKLLDLKPKNFSLEKMGFKKTDIHFPSKKINKDLVKDYDKNRNDPAADKTSRLSIHLRFGTKSIRAIVAETEDLNEVFLKELIWREFFMQILYHFPKVVTHNFKPKYDGIKWSESKINLEKWCEGKTGFPIVDAGMRELNETGFMHNRVRMITASFLVKDLLIDWRIGEAYFAEKLLDYELSSNNGNWQWAAGTGCDSAPYFRIFNPTSQQEKFDPDFKYVKKWVPEFGTEDYPQPMVVHKEARIKTLDAYKKALDNN